MADRERLEGVLADAGERWLDAKASGKDTAAVEAALKKAEDELARLDNQTQGGSE